MPEQHETEMDPQELLRLYDNGRRDFSDLEFLKYLDLENVALLEKCFGIVGSMVTSVIPTLNSLTFQTHVLRP